MFPLALLQRKRSYAKTCLSNSDARCGCEDEQVKTMFIIIDRIMLIWDIWTHGACAAVWAAPDDDICHAAGLVRLRLDVSFDPDLEEPRLACPGRRRTDGPAPERGLS